MNSRDSLIWVEVVHIENLSFYIAVSRFIVSCCTAQETSYTQLQNQNAHKLPVSRINGDPNNK
jgi:hypothetical protein